MAVVDRFTKQNQRAETQEAAILLGVTVQDLENNEMSPLLMKYYSDRYSTELLRNRISDLFGTLIGLSKWFILSIQIGYLVWLAWYIFAVRMEHAVYVWGIVPIFMVYMLAIVLVSLSVRVATGRLPGEARAARQLVVKAYARRHAA